MRTPQSIIKRPLLTEKSNKLRETGGGEFAPDQAEDLEQKISFEVARDANKTEIRDAVQKLFNVTVVDVRTAVVRGKWRRLGKFEGKRSNWKKAIVTLKPGDTIEFFEGV